MKKIINRSALFYLMVVLFLFICEVSFSQVKEFTGKNITQPASNYLGKYLKKYSVYKLDLNEIAAYTKSHSQKAQFDLNFSSEHFKLEIELNEIRAGNFKAVAMTDQGPRELVQPFTNTYKGFENNDRSNIVRLNIDDSTFEGYIKIGKKWLYFDKLKRYLPNESNDKIVVYDGADVIPDPTKKCGAEIIAAEKKKFNPNIDYNDFALTGNCHFVEIATEADFEYYQAFSSNASDALNRIRNILNLVEGLYTPSYNVKFILRYQQIWTTSIDPYSGETLEVILPQFTNWWNANRTSISRDVTHFFTGRTVTNSTIGYAYVGVVCNTSSYYSCVVNYSPVTNSTIALSAHELGHNFGANHDATCNGNNIMCPNIQSGIPQWSSQSLTEVSNYITSSGSCMTESFPANVTYFGNGAGVGYLKIIASNNITINSSSGAVQLSTAGYGYIEAGASIVLTPTNANSLGFLAPQGSSLLMRISDVINTCDPLIANSVNSTLNSSSQYNNPITKDIDVQILPNPFSSYFQLTVNLKEDKKVLLIIYNSLGIKVKEKMGINLLKGFNKVTFDGANLSKGVYLLEINFGNAKTVKKIVKI